MYDIEPFGENMLRFRLDVVEDDIPKEQSRGLVFDRYQDGWFYIKLDGGVNRGVIK